MTETETISDEKLSELRDYFFLRPPMHARDLALALDELKERRRVPAPVRVKVLPSQEHLNSRLQYDPKTGQLFWKWRDPASFSVTDNRGQEWAANAWNAHYAGVEAFTSPDRNGYRHGKIDKVKYQAHRVIWKMVYGVDPDTIDHIDGDQGNNRLANLRDCSVAENCRNYAKPATGTSKYRGVCWVKRDRKWAAAISDGDGGKRSLGHHLDELSAAKAYDRAAREMHGKFATLNFPEEVFPCSLKTGEAK